MRRTMVNICAMMLLAAVLPTSARAGGFHVSLLGTRRTSMLTNIGNPDDITALFHNPAGLAMLSGTRLHLSTGITFLDTSMKLQALDAERFPEINPNCGESGQQPCPWPIDTNGYYKKEIKPDRYLGIIPYLGVSQDLGIFAEGLEDWVVSAAIYSPGAYGGFLPKDAPSSYFITEALFVVAAATVGVGRKINEALSVGANLSYNYMRIKYARRFSTIDAMTPRDQSPDLTARLAQATIGDLYMDFSGLDHGIGWGVGALLEPVDWLSVGTSFGWFSSARFEGDVTLSGLGSGITGSSPLDADELRATVKGLDIKLPKQLQVDMPVPPSLLAGLSVRPTSWLEIGLDARLWLYTLYERQVIKPIYGANDQGSEPFDEDTLSSDKDYSNSWAVAFGLRVMPFAAHDIEFLTGISFDKSPVPDKSFSIDNPSMDQICWASGARATFAKNWRLGVSYMLIKYLERDVRTSQTWPPTNVVISNYSHIPSVELEYTF